MMVAYLEALGFWLDLHQDLAGNNTHLNNPRAHDEKEAAQSDRNHALPLPKVDKLLVTRRHSLSRMPPEMRLATRAM